MDAEWHQTNWSVNKAIDFINSRTEFDDPWLYSVNIFDPHHSFDPPRDYLPLPNYFDGELDNKPEFQRIDHWGAYASRKAHLHPEMSDDDNRLIMAAD